MTIETKTVRYRHSIASAAAMIVFVTARAAFAASAGMPWEGPLQQLVQSLTGPVAKGIGIAAIVMTALGIGCRRPTITR